MRLLDLAGRIFDKKLNQHAADAVKAPRVDTGLPFGANIGSLLSLPRASFALLNGSLLSVPTESQVQVAAISRLRLDADQNIGLYRLYTNCGNGRGGEGESFLQIMGTPDNIQDVAYYQFVCRLIPQTEEEQAAYLGNGYGLGEREYALADDLLGIAGYATDEIKSLIDSAGGDVIRYERDTPDQQDYIAPFQCRETRIDDAFGEKGLTQRMWFMPYVRRLPDQAALMAGGIERLLISYEAVESMDGQRKPQVHVDLMVGIALDPAQISVI